jgi:hypothetical protein
VGELVSGRRYVPVRAGRAMSHSRR